jgi:hypothetical protein
MRRAAPVSLFPLLVVFMAGVALADPLIGRTNLTIHRAPPGQVSAGDTITISGKLVGYPACRPGQTVWLVEVGTGTIDNTTTDGAGNYAFPPRVLNGTTSFQTRFEGDTIGQHPNEQVCAASVSSVLKIKIKGAHGATAHTKVLGEHGSLTSGRTAFAGGDLAAAAAVLVTLLLAAILALTLARRPSRGRG